MFGFNQNSEDSFGHRIAEYRNENLAIVQELKALIQFVNDPIINKLEKFNEGEIVGFFGSNDAKQILAGLRFKPVLIEHAQALIKVIEEENEKFALYLQSLKKDGIDNHNSLSSLLKTYNEKESALMEQLRRIIPVIQRLETLTIGIDEETLEHTTINYINMYNAFETFIKDKKNADVVFDSFKNIILFLGRYIEDIERFHTENARAFNEISNRQPHNQNAIMFEQNFFAGGGNLGSTIIAGLNKLLDKNINKSYAEFDKDLKTSADKFAKEKLNTLLGEFKDTSEDDAKLEDKIKDIFKVSSNMNELKDKWNKSPNLKKMLQNGITNAKLYPITGKTFKDILLPLETPIENQDKISIGKFETLFKKDDELANVEFIINYLENIIINNGNEYWEEETFEQFLENQRGILANTTTSSKGRKSKGDKWYRDAEEKDWIEEELDYLTATINDILSNEDSWEDTYNSNKSKIITDIKIIAKYFNENRSEYNKIDSLISDLKNIYNRFEKDIDSFDKIKRICGELNSIIEGIKNLK